MWKKYDYTIEFSKLREGFVYRPMINLSLFGKNDEKFNCFSLIDSGTDATMINADFAELLGIDESKCQKVKAGSIEKMTATGFVSEVKFNVEGFEEEFKIDAIFLKDMPIAGLLGQIDFFENFKIRFEKKHKKFYISRDL